jgi:hypothetical protein
VTLDGYLPKTETVLIAEATQTLDLNLDPNVAEVTLRVTPNNATVYWDGKEGGYNRLNLTPGRNYLIRVTAPGYVPFERKIKPKATHEFVDITLKAIQIRYGSISLGASPWAKVLIDGKEVGVTPLMDQKLTVGPHVIEFTNPYFTSVRRKANIVEGENPPIRVDLQQPEP